MIRKTLGGSGRASRRVVKAALFRPVGAPLVMAAGALTGVLTLGPLLLHDPDGRNPTGIAQDAAVRAPVAMAARLASVRLRIEQPSRPAPLELPTHAVAPTTEAAGATSVVARPACNKDEEQPASATTRSGGIRSLGRDDVMGQVSWLIATEFPDVLSAVRHTKPLHTELTLILTRATRLMPPRSDWNADEQAYEDVRDLALLRQHVSDATIRRLGYALPQLMELRDLSPSIVISFSCPRERSNDTGRPRCYVVRRAVIDGLVTDIERLEVERDDPQATAAADQALAARTEYERSVEAILGRPVFGQRSKE